MESDSNDSDYFNCKPAKVRFSSQVSKRFISAYMQHITDVCDPPMLFP